MTANTANSTAMHGPGLIRRLGYAGFAFFFIKGMLWLIAPFVFAWLI